TEPSTMIFRHLQRLLRSFPKRSDNTLLLLVPLWGDELVALRKFLEMGTRDILVSRSHVSQIEQCEIKQTLLGERDWIAGLRFADMFAVNCLYLHVTSSICHWL